MRRTLRAVGAIVFVVAVVAIASLVAVGVAAYRKAPGLVAALERSDALQLDPATLPPLRICALLTVQDRAFFRHHGIGMFDGPPLHTTLTQGICKGLFFEHFSPGVLRYRKLMLMADAVAFDLRVPKEVQLRIFVNQAYLGSADGAEVLGFAAAARAYFARELESLTDREYLGLVGMLVAPSTYHVVSQPEASARRVVEIERIVKGACPQPCLQVPPYAPCGNVVR